MTLQVPVVQGTDLLSSAEDALQAAERIGYPVRCAPNVDSLKLILRVTDHVESDSWRRRYGSSDM